ncbi:hypothetical protein AGMMS50255_4920 [Spirochaetia bacterium]|nr:hypothetical protein AGMMS50255_4920 [Spirochaetia bacterium]
MRESKSEKSKSTVPVRETLEYLDCPGGVKMPFVARTDFAREMIALRNKAVLTHGWIHGSEDEILAAIADGRAGGEGIEKLWRR